MNQPISEFWNSDIEKLIYEARTNPLRRSRINLHKSSEFGSQKMLIALFHDSKVGMHRHPVHKSETYVPLIGELVVDTLQDNELQTIKTTPINSIENSSKIVTHSFGIWHEPRSLSEYCVYLEIYDGPFFKSDDVEYLHEF
jgi:cupin fold WbuC family metalloprotein